MELVIIKTWQAHMYTVYMKLLWHHFLYQYNHIKGEYVMPMVLLVGPYHLDTR